jgi:MFS family permease
MLDPRVFRNARLSAGTLSILVQFFAFFGFTFTVLQYLQIIRGDSPILASVSVLPLAAGMLPVSRLTPALVGRFGARRVCAAGLTLMAVAFVVLAQLGTHTSYWLMVAGLVPLGIGMGAAMTPATSAISDALPAAQQGVGSALNDLSRELGGALGIAVLGSLLAATYRSRLPLPGVPAAVAAQARDSVALASRIGGSVSVSAHTAFMDGMHLALFCAAGASLLAAAAVTLLLRPHREASVAAEPRVAAVVGEA